MRNREHDDKKKVQFVNMNKIKHPRSKEIKQHEQMNKYVFDPLTRKME